MLGFAAALAPVVGVYAPLALAAGVLIIALFAVATRFARDRTWPRPARAPTIIIALAVIWSATSFIWSIDPSLLSIVKLARLAALLLAGLVLVDCARAMRPEEVRIFEKCMFFGFGLAIVVLVVDLTTNALILRSFIGKSGEWGGVSFRYNRGTTVMALMLWPVVLAATRRSLWLAAAIWAGTFAVIALFDSNAAKLGVLGGGLCVALSGFSPRRMASFAAAGIVAVMLATPFSLGWVNAIKEAPIGTLPIPNSSHHRLLIWKFTADRIAERPVLGWGFNSSRSIPGNKKDIAFASPALPLHPHNAWLQWTLELGVVGALLGAAIMAWLCLRARAEDFDWRETGATLGLVVATFLISGVAYGIWQSWWIGTMFFAASFLAASVKRDADDSS